MNGPREDTEDDGITDWDLDESLDDIENMSFHSFGSIDSPMSTNKSESLSPSGSENQTSSCDLVLDLVSRLEHIRDAFTGVERQMQQKWDETKNKFNKSTGSPNARKNAKDQQSNDCYRHIKLLYDLIVCELKIRKENKIDTERIINLLLMSQVSLRKYKMENQLNEKLLDDMREVRAKNEAIVEKNSKIIAKNEEILAMIRGTCNRLQTAMPTQPIQEEKGSVIFGSILFKCSTSSHSGDADLSHRHDQLPPTKHVMQSGSIDRTIQEVISGSVPVADSLGSGSIGPSETKRIRFGDQKKSTTRQTMLRKTKYGAPVGRSEHTISTPCSFCGQTGFKSKLSLNKHKQRHNQSKKGCPHCNLICRSDYLIQHINIKHTLKDKQLNQDLCKPKQL